MVSSYRPRDDAKKEKARPQEHKSGHSVSPTIELVGNPWWTLIILLELFVMFFMSFPRLDDLTWGSSVGIDRLSTWFAGYNGRYVGNLIVIALTRLPAGIRAGVELVVVGILLYYAHRLLPKKGAFCFFVLSLLCLPFPVIAQSVVWTSGFANYTTSAAVMLFIMHTYYRVVIEDEKLSRSGYIYTGRLLPWAAYSGKYDLLYSGLGKLFPGYWVDKKQKSISSLCNQLALCPVRGNTNVLQWFLP